MTTEQDGKPLGRRTEAAIDERQPVELAERVVRERAPAALGLAPAFTHPCGHMLASGQVGHFPDHL
jgi:hypothetical protein